MVMASSFVAMTIEDGEVYRVSFKRCQGLLLSCLKGGK